MIVIARNQKELVNNFLCPTRGKRSKNFLLPFRDSFAKNKQKQKMFTRFTQIKSHITRRIMTEATPNREVICSDAIEWLNKLPSEGLPSDCSIFTSLPDITELPHIFHEFLVNDYKEWFSNSIGLIMSKMKVGSYIILLQSDKRMMNRDREVYEWVDKGHLASCAADKHNCTLIWHKLVSSFCTNRII